MPEMTCLICGGPVTPVARVPYLRLPGECRFVACRSCETVFDEARLLNANYTGTNTAYTESDVKFYVEYAASIDSFAVLIGVLASAMGMRPADAPPLRVLDVGTAFGFAVALARDAGWDAYGVEPSRFGELGAQLLDVPIVPGYLDAAGFAPGSFDGLLMSDVIEHVPDPHALLRSALALLKPEGVLLLTTPNSEVVTQALEQDVTDVLSPGYHLIIFSPAGMQQVLNDLGLGEVRFSFEHGVSGRKTMQVLVARTPGVLPQELSWPQIRAEATTRADDYLARLIARKEQLGQNDMLYRGGLFRLMEKKIAQQAYPEAQALLQRLEAADGVSDWSIAAQDRLAKLDFPALVQAIPAYAGMARYAAGLLALEYQQTPAQAIQEFARAARLFAIEHQTGIFPRLGWPERAAYFQALACIKAGQLDDARTILHTLLDQPHTLPPDVLTAAQQTISYLPSAAPTLRERMLSYVDRLIHPMSGRKPR